MDGAKYIIVEHTNSEMAIVFNAVIDHSDIANGRKVTAAGFCSLLTNDGDSICVWGNSTTLKALKKPCESRPGQDESIIFQSLYS